MAFSLALVNCCYTKAVSDSRCWRAAWPAAQSFIGICRGEVGVRRSIRIALCFLACAWIASAGPVDFGIAEYNAALAARGLKWKVNAELSLDPPETFRIEPYRVGGAHITGGDL